MYIPKIKDEQEFLDSVIRNQIKNKSAGTETITKRVINIKSCNSVVCKNNSIIVDGKKIFDVDDQVGNSHIEIHVIVDGHVNSIDCSGSVMINGNVSGDIDCGGSCAISGSVSGDVDCGGDFAAKSVNGDVDAGGNVIVQK